MKKIKITNHLITMCKASAVLSVAVFQVSFFMKPYETFNQIHRDIAQASEVGTGSVSVGGNLIDLNIKEETSTNTIRLSGPGSIDDGEDEIDYTDLIPKNVPKGTTVKAALEKFDIKATQCLVHSDDNEEMEKLVSNLEESLEEYEDSKTKSNRSAVQYANYELAKKLRDLGLLKFKDNSEKSETDSDDISEYSVRSKRSENSSASEMLDPDNADDVKKIGECHLGRLADLSTDEERREYFKKHNLEKYADAIRVALDKSPEKVKKLVAELMTQSKTADQATDNQFALQYIAQAHAQSAIAIQASLAEIQLLKSRMAQNPNDQNLAIQYKTKENELNIQLTAIGAQAKSVAGMTPALATDPQALSQAHLSIDQVTMYWQNEAAKVISGQQGSLFSTSTLTAPSTVATSPAGTTTPTLNYSTPMLAGTTPTPNLDGNVMLLPGQSPAGNNSMRRSGGARPEILPGQLLGDQSLRPRSSGIPLFN